MNLVDKMKGKIKNKRWLPYVILKCMIFIFTDPQKARYVYHHRQYRRISFANKNKDKTFYIIRRDCFEDGFFANFIYVLDHIIKADERGWLPIVDMENYPTLYSEKEEINGTKNAWEYYFRKTIPYTLKEVYSSKHVIMCDPVYLEYKAPYYHKENNRLLTPERIQDLHYYIQKYIRINDKTEQKISEVYKKVFGKNKKVIGVHIRGTDMKVAGGRHPIPTNVEKVAIIIEKLIKSEELDAIFISTDEKASLKYLKERFGELIIHTNAIRAEEGATEGVHLNKELIGSRPHHMYLMGLEVLTDAILLSKCQYLICGHSNVAYAAVLFNNNQYKQIIWM